MNKNIEDIILTHLSGEVLSGEDNLLFDEWIDDSHNRKEYEYLLFLRKRSAIEFHIQGGNDEKRWNSLDSFLNKSRSFKNSLYRYASYAAAIMFPLFIVLGAYYIINIESVDIVAENVNHIKPGFNQAILTLSSGKTISLDKNIDALITNRYGATIAKGTKESLVYRFDSISKKGKTNKIYVPRGGEFQLTLSDGTRVWLNSETELKYEVCFNDSIRKVYLRGEAYFDVTHNKKKPFIVVSDRQDVMVYGTSFNVKDYKDEEFVETTLEKGSVKVFDKKSKLEKFIKPGEQSVLGINIFSVNKVDIRQYTSWKEGEFIFEHEKLSDIMRKISRWYDVEVFYMNDGVKDYHFTAWFKKDMGIDYVVKQLKATNKLNVRIKNRTIIISDKVR